MPWQFISLHFAPILEASKLSSSDIWPMDHIAMNILWDGLGDEQWGQQPAVPVCAVRIVRWPGQWTHWPPAIHSGNVHTSILHNNECKKPAGRGPPSNNFMLNFGCWLTILLPLDIGWNLSPVAVVSAVFNGSIQRCLSRPPDRHVSPQQDQRRRGFVGHTYYQH